MRTLDWKERVAVYALTGWCIEIAFTGIFSILTANPTLMVWTYIWMLPIWGLGILGLEKLSGVFDDFELNIRPRIIACMLACFALEFIAGTLLELVVGVIPWDYTSSEWNVNGVVRLDYAPFWAAVGIFLEPYLDFVAKLNAPKWIDDLKEKWRER